MAIGRPVAWIVALSAVSLVLAANVTELPPEIQVDRLLLQAERQSLHGEHWTAVTTLGRAQDVYEKHGLEIPAAFWFRKAVAQQSAGFTAQAIEAVTRYLSEAGRKGEHYGAALQILDVAEVDMARARVELERAKREAAVAAALQKAAQARGTRLEMITVSSGTFRMGCLSTKGVRRRGMTRCPELELPAHKVHMESFRLAKYETTVEEFNHFLDAIGKPRVTRGLGDGGHYYAKGDPEASDYGRLPVWATWGTAQEYLSWLSSRTGTMYRLPTESEWEYAARAGTKSPFHFGHDAADLCGYANFNGVLDSVSGQSCDDGFEELAPVGSFLRNSWGFHDMLGNGWEWVQDCFSYERGHRAAKGDGSPVNDDCDESHGSRKRVVRGGNAFSSWAWMRSAHRTGEREERWAAIRVAADVASTSER